MCEVREQRDAVTGDVMQRAMLHATRSASRVAQRSARRKCLTFAHEYDRMLGYDERRRFL
jgi:hypothetical protein